MAEISTDNLVAYGLDISGPRDQTLVWAYETDSDYR